MFETLFKSENNGDNGIGNASEGDDKKERIEKFRKKTKYFKDHYTEEEFFDFITDESEDFMGWSEWYQYRVCESVTLYNVKEDVYLETIKI